MQILKSNLVTLPWIPIRWADGRQELLSLEAIFRHSRQIKDLSCAPHERVSLIRLLVCITQAALGAPPSSYDWEEWGENIEAEAVAYLHKHQQSFHLFGDGTRFLQVDFPATSDPVLSSKLFPYLASGNNPTLFDHEGGLPRAIPAPQLALGLLTFQQFYPLYGAGYKGKGPCVDSNMAHALLLAGNLHTTIINNCLDEDTINRYFPSHGMGRPIWELSTNAPSSEVVATESYLGRLVARHRNLKLLDDGTGFYLTKDGYNYPTFAAAREPSATVIIRKKNNEEALLSARLDRSLWRDLHAMTVKKHDGENSAPLVLQSHISAVHTQDVDIWVGALITDLKAKILDTVESTFIVPTTLLADENASLLYGKGVAYAEAFSTRVWHAVKTYFQYLKSESPQTAAAQQFFWNVLDQQVSLLFDIVRRVSQADADGVPEPVLPFGQRNEQGQVDAWTFAVRQAARSAYDATCPSASPRQYKAHAMGLRELFSAPRKAARKTAATATATQSA